MHASALRIELSGTQRFGGVSQRAVRQWLVAYGTALRLEGRVISVLLCDEATIAQINGRWRAKPKVTDVLAFPQTNAHPSRPVPPGLLGDILVCVPQARRQANEHGRTLAQELAFLLAHGLLHLLGHDHVHGGRQALRMRECESRLARLVAPFLRGR